MSIISCPLEHKSALIFADSSFSRKKEARFIVSNNLVKMFELERILDKMQLFIPCDTFLFSWTDERTGPSLMVQPVQSPSVSTPPKFARNLSPWTQRTLISPLSHFQTCRKSSLQKHLPRKKSLLKVFTFQIVFKSWMRIIIKTQAL